MKLRIGCVVAGFLSFVLSLAAQTASPGSFRPAKALPQAGLTVEVPFEFVVGNRTFAAGIYTFRSLLNSVPGKASTDVLEVRSAVGSFYSAMVAEVVGGSEPSPPRLVFARSGGHAFLTEVWEAGRRAGCRLRLHKDKGQMEPAASGNDNVTLTASAD